VMLNITLRKGKLPNFLFFLLRSFIVMRKLQNNGKIV
jgi:hypothetical protein